MNTMKCVSTLTTSKLACECAARKQQSVSHLGVDRGTLPYKGTYPVPRRGSLVCLSQNADLSAFLGEGFFEQKLLEDHIHCPVVTVLGKTSFVR